MTKRTVEITRDNLFLRYHTNTRSFRSGSVWFFLFPFGRAFLAVRRTINGYRQLSTASLPENEQ